MAKYLDAAQTTGDEVYIDVTGPWIMIVHSAAAKVTLEAKYPEDIAANAWAELFSMSADGMEQVYLIQGQTVRFKTATAGANAGLERPD